MTARRLPTALLCTVACFVACNGGSDAAQTQDPNLFRVKRDDLPIVVRENAELQALRETIVRSEVEGQATVIYIIPEGTMVQKGEKLVELDVSELVEKRASQAINVSKAEAMLVQATKEKEILEKELTTKRNTAASNLRIAEMELEKLLGRKTGANSSEGKNSDMIKRLQALVQPTPEETQPLDATDEPNSGNAAPALATHVNPRSYAGLVEKVRELLTVATPDNDPSADRDMGDMANQILQQVDQIRLAAADLKVKEDTLLYSQRLAKKQFITRNELEKDQLAWQSQVSKVALSWNDLDLLINYTLAKNRIKLTQDRDNAQLEVERVKGANEAAVIKADSDLTSRRDEYELAKERLENLDRQINSAVIHAPTPGTVVYARIDRNRGGGDAVREGVQVRERQELIILPDTTKMRCVVKVQEAQVDKVARGQPSFVTVEAFQGETFTGRVTNVAPVADSNSGWMTSDRKVYTTVVELDSDNPDGRLRSRMAANVTIMVETVKATLPVPLQAVYRDRGVNYVWKKTAGGPIAVSVQCGRQNTERVEILEGVAEEDMLHLTPPAGVQPPKFEQPAVPTPAPLKDNAPADAPGPNANGNGNGSGPKRAPGMGSGRAKKLADMTPEELTDYKDGLGMMQGMVDKQREAGNDDIAKQMEQAIESLRKALDANDLVAGQTHQDKLRSLMRSAMGSRSGKDGGSGDRPRRGGGGGGGGGGPVGPGRGGN